MLWVEATIYPIALHLDFYVSEEHRNQRGRRQLGDGVGDAVNSADQAVEIHRIVAADTAADRNPAVHALISLRPRGGGHACWQPGSSRPITPQWIASAAPRSLAYRTITALRLHNKGISFAYMPDQASGQPHDAHAARVAEVPGRTAPYPVPAAAGASRLAAAGAGVRDKGHPAAGARSRLATRRTCRSCPIALCLRPSLREKTALAAYSKSTRSNGGIVGCTPPI